MVAKKTAKATKAVQEVEAQASKSVSVAKAEEKVEEKAKVEETQTSSKPPAKKVAPKTKAKKVSATKPEAEEVAPAVKTEKKPAAKRAATPKPVTKDAKSEEKPGKASVAEEAKASESVSVKSKATPEPAVKKAKAEPKPAVEEAKVSEPVAEKAKVKPEPAAEKAAAEPKPVVEEAEAATNPVVEEARPQKDSETEQVPESTAFEAQAEEAAAPEKNAASPEANEGAVVPAEQDAPAALEFADVPGVLIAAAECAPLVKIGGLADVVGALPKYLKKLGVDARIIMPFHRQIKERYGAQAQHMCDFQASLGWRSQYVGLERLELDGTVYYFIDNEFYFGGPVYCGGEFEGEQYAFFTRAVMDSIPLLDFDVRILHCNDWHTAMMPLLVKTQYHGGMQAGLKTIQTIHNLHFQGQFSHEFDRDLLRVDDSLATPQFIEHYGCDNMLKAGIVFADKVNTVSPTYAREICTYEQGESLDGVLRSRGGDLWGILNGIDTDVWNPSADHNLPMSYSIKSLWRKARVRADLLEELGLEPAGDQTPVLSMVGRLTSQKGLDLVKWTLDEIMREDIRVIVLGTGDPELEGFFRDAEYRYKGRLCSYIGYNGELSHRIYAGSDLFLMPSLFEPCGISQMIALRYGTLPIVRETGGLKDTVIPYNQYTGEGNGFSFANYDAYEMLQCIRYAIATWRNPEVRKQLIAQAMASDYGFDRCARAYAELYRSVL